MAWVCLLSPTADWNITSGCREAGKSVPGDLLGGLALHRCLLDSRERSKNPPPVLKQTPGQNTISSLLMSTSTALMRNMNPLPAFVSPHLSGVPTTAKLFWHVYCPSEIQTNNGNVLRGCKPLRVALVLFFICFFFFLKDISKLRVLDDVKLSLLKTFMDLPATHSQPTLFTQLGPFDPHPRLYTHSRAHTHRATPLLQYPVVPSGISFFPSSTSSHNKFRYLIT